jgi:hypothetical protein
MNHDVSENSPRFADLRAGSAAACCLGWVARALVLGPGAAALAATDAALAGAGERAGAGAGAGGSLGAAATWT